MNNRPRFRSVWIGVLLVGIIFGLAGLKPIPAIILAQALNGIVLPFATITLMIVVNDTGLMGKEGCNHWFSNTIMTIVVLVTVITRGHQCGESRREYVSLEYAGRGHFAYHLCHCDFDCCAASVSWNKEEKIDNLIRIYITNKNNLILPCKNNPRNPRYFIKYGS